MLWLRYYLLGLCILTCQTATWAGDKGGVRAQAKKTVDQQVRRNYLNTSKYLISSHAVVLQGSPQQVMRMSSWLDEIYRIPIGRETLEAIMESGNQLTIRHSAWALQASGRTLAPVSENLTNGCGTDVEIMFDARIPDEGSHFVFDSHKNLIEFTAVQNLFHELVHARHLVNGTWRYFDSEGQAIEGENVFRQQHSESHGLQQASLRAAIDGQQFWWPESGL
jgi:hypothetical protein